MPAAIGGLRLTLCPRSMFKKVAMIITDVIIGMGILPRPLRHGPVLLMVPSLGLEYRVAMGDRLGSGTACQETLTERTCPAFRRPPSDVSVRCSPAGANHAR